MKRLLSILCSVGSLFAFAKDKNEIKEHFVAMRDGVKLYTMVSIPENSQKLPVIVIRSPYAQYTKKEVAKLMRRYRKSPQFGYALVVQHCRGTGKSEGEFIPYINEKNDGLDLLEWVRKQDFYNGEIYLSGGSYLASVQAAILNVPQPDIRGCFFAVQDSERYNIIYRNGFMRLKLHAGWYVNVYKIKSVKRTKKAARFETFPLAGITPKIFGEKAADFEEALLHPDRNDPFWKTPGYGGGEFSDALVNSQIPIMLIGSWHDIYISGMFDIWRKLTPEHKKKCVFIVTPFEHAYMRRRKGIHHSLTSPGGSPLELLPGKDLNYQWFDHVRGGALPEQIKKGEITRYQLFGGKWLTAPDVGSNSVVQKFYLSGKRTLSAIPVENGKISYDYDPRNPAEFKGGCDGVFGGVELQDAPNSRPDIISFVTDKFEKDMVLEGACKVKLHVSSTAPDSCFYARLSIVKPDGTLGLRHDIDSICRTNPEFKANGEAVIDLTMAPHNFKIARGEALRLDVSSSCWPFFQLHSNYKGNQALQTKTQVSRNTIITGKSFIEIPFSESGGEK